MDLRADQYLGSLCSVTITRCPVHRLAYHRELHSLLRTDESVQNFSHVNANSNLAHRVPACLASCAHTFHGLLHLHTGHNGMSVMSGIRFGTAKYRQDCVSHKFVNGPIIAKDAIRQDREVFIQKHDHVLGTHTRRKTCESANVATQYGNYGLFAP